MDINAVLSTLTAQQFGQWIAGGPEGWDQWLGGFAFTEDGPVSLVAGQTGLLVVTTNQPGVVTLHGHGDAEGARLCWERIAAAMADMCLQVDPRSTYTATPASAETLALPVSTDEPNARPFGWL